MKRFVGLISMILIAGSMLAQVPADPVKKKTDTGQAIQSDDLQFVKIDFAAPTNYVLSIGQDENVVLALGDSGDIIYSNAIVTLATDDEPVDVGKYWCACNYDTPTFRKIALSDLPPDIVPRQ